MRKLHRQSEASTSGFARPHSGSLRARHFPRPVDGDPSRYKHCRSIKRRAERAASRWFLRNRQRKPFTNGGNRFISPITINKNQDLLSPWSGLAAPNFLGPHQTQSAVSPPAPVNTRDTTP